MGQFYVEKDSWIPKIAELCEKEPVIGLDIETFCKKEYRHLNIPKAATDPWVNDIRSIQISTPQHDWFIDLFRVRDIEPIKRLIQSTKVVKCIHNSLFETKNFLKHWNIYPDNVFDPMHASRLFQAVLDFTWKNKLGDVVERYLGKTINKDEQLSDWSVWDLSSNQIEYGWSDSRHPLELYQPLKTLLEEAGMYRSFKIECDVVLPCAEMELYGVRVDLAVISSIEAVTKERLQALQKKSAYFMPHRLAGLFEQEGINLRSGDQVRAALKEQFDLTIEKVDDDDETVGISKALLPHRKKHPELIDTILDYGSLYHNLTTYCTPILKHIHPVTGKIHPRYKQLRQWQHRATLSSPNLNLPRPNSFGPGVTDPIFKPSFFFERSYRESIVPDMGNLFSIVDYSGNQSRIVADIANEPTMKAEFALGDLADLYSRTYAEIMGKEKVQVLKAERQMAKTWVLAFLFAAGAMRYLEQKLEDTRIESSYRQCKKERDAFFGVFTGLAAWHDLAPRIARENGYVESLIGRKIYMNEAVCTLNRAVNFPVCATEVDGAKLAGGRLSRALRAAGLRARPAIFVYDEWVLEGPGPDIFTAHEMQKKIMKDAMQEMLRDVPAAVEGSIGAHWGAK